MPWSKDGQTWTWPPRPKEAEPQPLPPGVTESSDEAYEQRRRERDAGRRYMQAAVIDFVRMHKYCPRTACRRAGRCAVPSLPCHEENFESLAEYIYRPLRRARQRGGAPPPDHERPPAAGADTAEG